MDKMEKPDKTVYFKESEFNNWDESGEISEFSLQLISINKAFDRLQVTFKVKNKEVFKPLNHSDMHIPSNTTIYMCMLNWVTATER